ncbi:MAG: thioredoxin family protein [Polyangiaceae bacterium]|nr:thioredoxin family protein [Polyangiaceae bacterium]
MVLLRSLALIALLVFTAACENKPSGSGLSAAETFKETTDAEVNAALAAAKEKARAEGKWVLLEFVASWCTDCREVAKIARQEPAASVLAEKYIVVPVNVGRFNRNKALIAEHQIKVIAALVVIDADGKRIAKTTLEPITKKNSLTSESLADWLKSPKDS